MSLNEKIKSLTGNKRTFILMRIAGLDADFAKQLTGVTRGTYNSWFKNNGFSIVYHELPELIREHRQEAVQILRKDNQLEAVLLEGKILAKLKEEIENGEYVLVKTHLAREVYSKLMSDLDAVPQVKVLSWQQRIQNLFPEAPKQIPQEVTIDAEFEEISSEPSQHSEGFIISESQSPNDEDKKAA